MKYEVVWSTGKVIQRATIVMNFWNGVADKAKEKLGQLQPAERDDKTHQGTQQKLKRMADAAKGQAWRAQVLLGEAQDCYNREMVSNGAGAFVPLGVQKDWAWTSDDLLWFYPELASSEDSLLQLGL